jgi:outer membrane protein assembly factor BamB
MRGQEKKCKMTNEKCKMQNESREKVSQRGRFSVRSFCIFHFAFFICHFFCVGTGQAADWPQFRGPNGSAVSEETGLPTTWTASDGLRWKVALPGRGLSSPVIAGGRLYLTACTGYLQDRLHVLCFDVATGKRLWERQLTATGNTLCHPKTCMAAPTSVTDGQRVFAMFATGDLAGFDKDGGLLWYRSIVGDYPTVGNNIGMAASPILWQDVLFVPMESVGESFVAGIDANTGRNLWKVDRRRDINWTTPCLLTRNGQTEVLFQSHDELTAYDPRTGAKRWGYQGQGLSTIPSPIAVNDLVLTPGGGELTALRPTAGDAPEVLWQATRLRAATPTPLVYRGRVYALSSAGVLNCADLKDGKILWQERVKGPISSSPVAADGKIYVFSEEGVASVVQVGDEPKLLATNSLGETILATPAIADGAIFIRSDQHLYCIGAKRSQ